MNDNAIVQMVLENETEVKQPETFFIREELGPLSTHNIGQLLMLARERYPNHVNFTIGHYEAVNMRDEWSPSRLVLIGYRNPTVEEQQAADEKVRMERERKDAEIRAQEKHQPGADYTRWVANLKGKAE